MRDYHKNIFYSEEDGGYIADIPDLESCTAFGATPEDALAEVERAKATWLEAARQAGKPIPPPRYAGYLPDHAVRGIRVLTGQPVGKSPQTETFFLTHYESPLGPYVAVTSHRGVVCLAPEEEKTRLARWQKSGIQIRDVGPHNQALTRELDAYFSGKLRQFSVPLDLRGTPFQRRVWALLCGIPYGETRSYRWVAQGLGRPMATRAVGQAIGSNPVAIVVPCHRVIGSDGKLTGYAGGLFRKQALLDLEAAAPKRR